MGWRTVRRFLVALVLFATSACGGPGAYEAIRAAPDLLRDAGTAHFSMSMFFESEELPEGSAELTGEGAGDFAAQRMRVTMTLPAEEGEADALIDGSVMYLDVPFLHRFLPEDVRWLRVDLTTAPEDLGLDLSGLLQAGQSDPSLTLQTLRGVAEDVETVGEDEVRGTAVTHYRASVTKERVLEEVPEDVREDVRGVFDQLGLPDSYPLEVWLDEDGFARRLRFSVTSLPGEREAPLRQTVTTEFFDFGEPVDITLPGDGEAADLADLITRDG